MNFVELFFWRWKDMGPVTTNPWLIAVINMAIVFGVLIALGLLMNLLQVLDPTKTKTHS